MTDDAAPGGILPIDLNERLHVDIGAFCNNNCLFCMEEDRAGRQERVGLMTPEDVFLILESNRFRREVMFVSGEPTLNPNFLTYVRKARTLGYEKVGVISNGQRFAHEPTARRLVAAGLNHVIISIHGPDARTHDALTRTPGSFVNTLQGIRNLSALSRKTPLQLNTSTVLNRRNSTPDALDALVSLLSPLVHQMVFNIMQPFGRGETHFERLMLRYEEMAQRLADFFARHAGEELPIYLVDIPYCVTHGKGIPDSARGFIERYVHYEISREEPAEPSPSAGDQSGGAAMKQAALEGGQTGELPEHLSARHRDGQEKTFKVKPESCETCIYSALCDGIWMNYVRHFGLEEFQPVAGPRTELEPDS